MKKILFVVNVDWFFVSHRLPIAVEAIKNGYEVHLACSFTDKKEELIEMGINVHEVAFSRSGNSILNEVKTLVKLNKIIKSIAPDLLHAITIKAVIYSGLVLRTLKTKPALVVAISGLGYVFSADTNRAKLLKLLVTVLYRFALSHRVKMIIFQNQSDEAILTKAAKLSPLQKVLIRGSGADLEQYSFKKELDCSPIRVAMACRLLREKGVYEFIAAAKLLHDKGVDVDFQLIGAVDPENPNSVLDSEVQYWKQSGIVNLLGHRDDVHRIFAESHIVTLPSYYGEGVPKVLIEASACGRPIVTTDNPGCRDAIIAGETGLLVPVRNAEALAKAIQQLAENKIMRINMGTKARLFAEQEFDVRSVVNKHLDIYSSLLSNKK
jgi:glycosyltransferase involved in cell wall biosynthesis